jgi:hypothetical protein
MVFSAHRILVLLVSFQGEQLESDNFIDKGLSMQALSSHIELLYHLSLTIPGSEYFLRSSIKEQMINIQNFDSLISIACDT